jgi:hypothetical protein
MILNEQMLSKLNLETKSINYLSTLPLDTHFLLVSQKIDDVGARRICHSVVVEGDIVKTCKLRLCVIRSKKEQFFVKCC